MLRFSIPSSDGKTELAAYKLVPEQPRAMVQISHGMKEYFLRYEGFADYLAQNGFLVFGHDHLGHGNTAKSSDDLGFTVSADALVEDVHNLSLAMKKEYPALPLILFGHSMGSFIARAVLEQYAADYSAAVICGTGGPDTPAGAGKLLARLLIALRGERHRSAFVTGVAFGTYNKKFEKGCDKNAWLSRDTAIVDRYNADPFCAYTFTLRGYADLFSLVGKVNRRAWFHALPKDLPLLVVSGTEDPVGSWDKGVHAVADRLQGAGMKDVTLRLYHEMRHEILNEIGKEQVWKETLKWMEQSLS